MNTQAMDKIKDFYKNPIIFFAFSAILLSLVLLFGCHFHVPDYYTDFELAHQVAQTVSPDDVSKAVEHLLNPKYNIYNSIFQLWGWALALFIFCGCFRVNKFKRFKELAVLNKKPFVYLWFNFSYPLWSFAYLSGYMNNLDKYVYNSGADSMGIPFFMTIGMLTFIGIIYYIFINFLSFITFNTKIKRFFYNFLWAFVFIFWV